MLQLARCAAEPPPATRRRPATIGVEKVQRVIAALALITMLALTAGHGQQPPAHVMESAVTILRQNGAGESAHGCSGAVVALPQGNRVISAGHCTGNEYRYYARDVSGTTYTLRLEEAVTNLPHGDYAIFKSVAAHLLPALEVGEPPRLGDTVYTVSDPLDYGLLFFVGRYAGTFNPPAGHAKENWRGSMVMDLSGARGSSGSIVVNQQGQAIGILSGQFIVHPGQGMLGHGPEQLSGLLAVSLPHEAPKAAR